MMRCTRLSSRLALSGVVACSLGCGSAEGGSELFQPAQAPGEVKDVPPDTQAMPLTPVDVAPNDPMSTPPGEGTIPGTIANPPMMMQPAPGSGCRPSLGVSGAPTTISEALILLNTLPKPTSLACFLEALERPLTLYLTKSNQSLQPSPGPRSPRTFVLRGELEMSIVLEGPASNTLEFGFRPTVDRSIKAEIVFPITRDVNEATLFDRIRVTERTTQCGACHVREEHRDFPGFPAGVFESDIYAPFEFEEVGLESLRTERMGCDAVAEPYRCELLAALFDHGEVVPGVLRGPE